MSELPEWATTLPESLHAAPYLKGSDTPEQFLEQVQAAANWQGNSIRIPGPDAGEADMGEFQTRVMEKIPGLMAVPNLDNQEQIDAIMGRLGKPQNAENYLQPEGVDVSGDELGKLKAQAHGLSMTQKQFETWLSGMSESAKQSQAATDTLLNEQKAILEKEWGGAHLERVTAIQGLLNADGAPADLRDAVNNGTLNADSMRWLFKLSQLGEETPQIGNQADGTPRALDTMEIESQLVEVENQLFEGGRAMQPSNPSYTHLVAKRMQLMKAKHGMAA
jgi:hypothetical protein